MKGTSGKNYTEDEGGDQRNEGSRIRAEKGECAG